MAKPETHAGGNSPLPVAARHTQERDAKPLPLTREEFGLMAWAGKTTRRRGPQFVRDAIFTEIQKVIAGVVAHGGKIPPGVAHDFEKWKLQNAADQRESGPIRGGNQH